MTGALVVLCTQRMLSTPSFVLQSSESRPHPSPALWSTSSGRGWGSASWASRFPPAATACSAPELPRPRPGSLSTGPRLGDKVSAPTHGSGQGSRSARRPGAWRPAAGSLVQLHSATKGCASTPHDEPSSAWGPWRWTTGYSRSSASVPRANDAASGGQGVWQAVVCLSRTSERLPHADEVVRHKSGGEEARNRRQHLACRSEAADSARHSLWRRATTVPRGSRNIPSSLILCAQRACSLSRITLCGSPQLF